MQAREYLEQIEKIDRVIQNKIVEVYQLRCLATSVTASIGDGSSGRSGHSDKVGNIVTKIIDLENEINMTIDNFVGLKNECVKAIEQVPNPLQYTVLHKHYIQYKPLIEIAAEENYSYQYILEVHRAALEKIQNIQNNL